jgi:hypothetical protein
MASISMHLPPALVAQLDAIAARRGTSRDRLIVQACEALLAAEPGVWPPGFFETELTPEEQAILQTAGEEMEATILASRRDKSTPPAPRTRPSGEPRSPPPHVI